MRSIKITIYADVPDDVSNEEIVASMEGGIREQLYLYFTGTLEGFAIHPAEGLPGGESRHGGLPPGGPGAGSPGDAR